jgi:hypothetical protein
MRPDYGQDKKEETSSEKGKIPPFGGRNRLDSFLGEKTISFQEFHSLKKARQHGGIADRIASPPLYCVFGDQNIVPVVQSQVKHFENEPETHGPGKKKEKLPEMVGEEG